MWPLLILAAACGNTPDTTQAVQPGRLSLSVDVVDFDVVTASGAAAEPVILTNTGGLSVGVHAFELVQDLPSFGFDLDCDAWSEPGATGPACLIEPGESARIFLHMNGGQNAHQTGTLRFQTLGAAGAESIDDVFADSRHPWMHIGLGGLGVKEAGTVRLETGGISLGEVLVGQRDSRRARFTNWGPGPTRVTDVSVAPGPCDSTLVATVAQQLPLTLEPGQHSFIELGYAPIAEESARCTVQLTTQGLTDVDEPVTVELSVVARSTLSLAPRTSVEILSPSPGFRHTAEGPFTLKLQLRDVPGDFDSVLCAVRSARVGEPDGKPPIKTCSPQAGNTDGIVEVEIDPAFYIGKNADVLWIDATDSTGWTAQASIPILFDVPVADDDADGDGFGRNTVPVDCDDTRVDVHPLAIEVFDGVDTDCDNIIDTGFDLDGDGQTRRGGDCDDNDPTTFIGAPEIRDLADNDCDGRVDEDTSGSDDDGDGKTELQLDCDDTDPFVGPDAEEVCFDGIDNDCDGKLDASDPEGCTLPGAAPILIGSIYSDSTAVEEGERVTMRIAVTDPDDDLQPIQWGLTPMNSVIQGEDTVGIWTVEPGTVPAGSDSVEVMVSALVSDGSGREIILEEPFTVVRSGTLDQPVQVIVPEDDEAGE
ncbi:MAG: putative metal-binding motif-containing protein [Myxococcota bacterium]